MTSRPPVEPGVIDQAQAQVGLRSQPLSSRCIAACNGVYGPRGFLWIVWQSNELVTETIGFAGRTPSSH